MEGLIFILFIGGWVLGFMTGYFTKELQAGFPVSASKGKNEG